MTNSLCIIGGLLQSVRVYLLLFKLRIMFFPVRARKRHKIGSAILICRARFLVGPGRKLFSRDAAQINLGKCPRMFYAIMMSLVLRKPVFGVSTRSDTNRAVQLQKWARDLKFRMLVVEGLYYPYSENKGADQLRGYREADLRLCFRKCKNPVFSCRGSYEDNEGVGQSGHPCNLISAEIIR